MSGRLEADEARRQSVLADVAHELRTPITVIRAQAEGIVDGVYAADAEHLRPVLSAARTLEVLVDDLRTLALAEAGSLHLRREPVDLSPLVLDTLATFADVATAAGARLVADIRPPGMVVGGDAVRLGSVLANLVGNALRHVHSGGEVRVEASQNEESTLIVVRDDGDGIPAELLPRVFDRFVKGAESPGSGLGLAIVRDIAEAHGGAVTAVSTPEAGTSVSVTLPSGAV
jgi:signal transduction histidine kinase